MYTYILRGPGAACTKKIHVMHELERARAEVCPVYDHYQMYMYHI